MIKSKASTAAINIQAKGKILEKYNVLTATAERYASELIRQIEKHGGNPEKEDQIDRSIDTVVKKWIEKGY